MSVFKALEFDGVNSLDNSVYISGDAVFDAPERDVEMVDIPGRNGALVRDNGRFHNIEVTYPAGVKGTSEAEFATKMRAFRNILASRRGYKRLEDDYNPDEFRLGTFINAIEVEPSTTRRAGEFDLVFNCKPQRFLKSGETAVNVNSGDTITNPTLFDASPMILAEGYGVLNVNGYEIEITNEVLGNIILNYSTSNQSVFNAGLVNPGDTIYVDRVEIGLNINTNILAPGATVTDIRTVTAPGTANALINLQGNNSTLLITFPPFTLTAGTALTINDSWTVGITVSGGSGDEILLTPNVQFNGTDKITCSIGINGSLHRNILKTSARYIGDVSADSTVSTLGNPTYVDCDAGEVYKIENGSFVSLNHLTDLGSNLPVLSPGENAITYDNTFESVSIIPRWWVI